jgi:hypothetical protein
MIVVFKTGAPSLAGPRREAPPGFTTTAVESRRRYLICSITIIDYNLKALRASDLQPGGIAITER